MQLERNEDLENTLTGVRDTKNLFFLSDRIRQILS